MAIAAKHDNRIIHAKRKLQNRAHGIGEIRYLRKDYIGPHAENDRYASHNREQRRLDKRCRHQR